jgi:hypothetical protein
MDRDPLQFTNLVKEETHAAVVKEMSKRLEARLASFK